MSVVNYKNYGRPAGYQSYDWPYNKQNLPGTKAKFHLMVLTTTVADLDGATLTVPVLLTPTQLSNIVLTFDDDAAPPSTATTIKIQGLVNSDDIAEQIALSLSLIGLEVVREVNELYVTQSFQGSNGNGEIESTGLGADEIAINGIDDFVGHNVFFWDGNDQIPKLWGPQRGFVGSVPTVPFAQVPV
jgi:hypothetical protein